MTVMTGLAIQASAVTGAERLTAMDTDQDGKVSMQEFLKKQTADSGRSTPAFKAAAKKRFKARDKDGDGFLNAAELGPGKKKAPKVKAAGSQADDSGSDSGSEE
jgi:Ca2+-binding EF-hand superfamily protein